MCARKIDRGSYQLSSRKSSSYRLRSLQSLLDLNRLLVNLAFVPRDLPLVSNDDTGQVRDASILVVNYLLKLGDGCLDLILVGGRLGRRWCLLLLLKNGENSTTVLPLFFLLHKLPILLRDELILFQELLVLFRNPLVLLCEELVCFRESLVLLCQLSLKPIAESMNCSGGAIEAVEL